MFDHNAEFKSVMAAADTIITAAKNDRRAMTADEKATVERYFSRLKEIKGEKDKASDESDNGIAEIASKSYRPASTKRSDYNGWPLKGSESLFSKLALPTPSVSLGQFMRAAVVGPRNDAERFALATGSDSTGGFDLSPSLSAQFIDSFRAESAYVRAGALVLPLLDRQKASRVTDPTATWRAEDAAVSTAAPFASVDLDPKSLSVIVKISREQLEDSINVDSEIERTIASAMAYAADKAIGFGSGSGEPLGIASTSGIGAVTSATNGTALSDYSKLLAALYELQSNNSNPTAVVLSPRESQTFNGFTDTTDQPLRRPEALTALPFYVSPSVPITQTQGTSSVASTILMGDFSRLLIAVRVALRIEVLKERFADNNQYGFQATLRLDSAPTRVKSFCKISGIIPAA